MPIGASGSSAISAKLLVFAGAFVHVSGGEMSLPWQVYFRGIGWPSEKAVLVMGRFISFLCGLGSSAPLAVVRQPSNAAANNKFIRAFMAGFYSGCPQTQMEFSLAATGTLTTMRAMFSHIVVFWTVPSNPAAADELLAGANQLLKNIPGVVQFHAGKMAPSHRPVVEQSYQVALNLIFPNKKA